MELLSSQRKMAWRGIDKRQFQFVGMKSIHLSGRN